MACTEATPPRGLNEVIARLPAQPSVQRIRHDGHVYWVKQPEVRNLRWRLQKGDPQRSFARERGAWQQLAGQGDDLPLAPLVLSTPGCVVTKEAGRPISDLVADSDTTPEAREAALIGAARALCRLHAAGVAHGRPNLKDILWDGRRAVFIDLEQFGARRPPARARRRDFILFAFSCFASFGQHEPAIDHALRAYAACDRHGTVAAALRLLRRLSPLGRVAGRIGRWSGSREWQAVPLLIDWARQAQAEGLGQAGQAA